MVWRKGKARDKFTEMCIIMGFQKGKLVSKGQIYRQYVLGRDKITEICAHEGTNLQKLSGSRFLIMCKKGIICRYEEMFSLVISKIDDIDRIGLVTGYFYNDYPGQLRTKIQIDKDIITVG